MRRLLIVTAAICLAGGSAALAAATLTYQGFTSQGHQITFINDDAAPAVDTPHTITACRAPCNKDTGIAYPIANASRGFDSQELGHNSTPFGAPASGSNTWTTPKNLKAGTYTYFCRIHPFMRGSFRVINRN